MCRYGRLDGYKRRFRLNNFQRKEGFSSPSANQYQHFVEPLSFSGAMSSDTTPLAPTSYWWGLSPFSQAWRLRFKLQRMGPVPGESHISNGLKFVCGGRLGGACINIYLTWKLHRRQTFFHQVRSDVVLVKRAWSKETGMTWMAFL